MRQEKLTLGTEHEYMGSAAIEQSPVEALSLHRFLQIARVRPHRVGSHGNRVGQNLYFDGAGDLSPITGLRLEILALPASR
jgi:hypothetical protein